jgi:hypothetical protein
MPSTQLLPIYPKPLSLRDIALAFTTPTVTVTGQFTYLTSGGALGYYYYLSWGGTGGSVSPNPPPNLFTVYSPNGSYAFMWKEMTTFETSALISWDVANKRAIIASTSVTWYNNTKYYDVQIFVVSSPTGGYPSFGTRSLQDFYTTNKSYTANPFGGAAVNLPSSGAISVSNFHNLTLYTPAETITISAIGNINASLSRPKGTWYLLVRAFGAGGGAGQNGGGGGGKGGCGASILIKFAVTLQGNGGFRISGSTGGGIGDSVGNAYNTGPPNSLGGKGGRKGYYGGGAGGAGGGAARVEFWCCTVGPTKADLDANNSNAPKGLLLLVGGGGGGGSGTAFTANYACLKGNTKLSGDLTTYYNNLLYVDTINYSAICCMNFGFQCLANKKANPLAAVHLCGMQGQGGDPTPYAAIGSASNTMNNFYPLGNSRYGATITGTTSGKQLEGFRGAFGGGGGGGGGAGVPGGIFGYGYSFGNIAYTIPYDNATNQGWILVGLIICGWSIGYYWFPPWFGGGQGGGQGLTYYNFSYMKNSNYVKNATYANGAGGTGGVYGGAAAGNGGGYIKVTNDPNCNTYPG